jgi:hypothetical protein
MEEADIITQILNNARSDKETKDLFSQVDDFDMYLKTMHIEITKKRIMMYREDFYPQIVNINR